VNYADTHQAENTYLSGSSLPFVPGAEVVGFVVDPGGRQRRVCGFVSRGGGYAELAVVRSGLSFEVPVGKGAAGKVGDAFDRYQVRVLEMVQSCRLVRQALDKMPEGEFMAKVPRKIKPEAGEALSRVESARGEMAYYVVSDGTDKAYRVRARTGSFLAMGIIEDISPGMMIADLVALIASLDVVAPEIDR
jgi:NADH:ubiquinone oxidoreductase subunit D